VISLPRSLRILIVTATLPALLAGQQPSLVLHYSIPLMDFGFIGDTMSGVTFVASPSITTAQARDSTSIAILELDPDSLVEWLASVDIDSQVANPTGASADIRWGPALRRTRGPGGIAIGQRMANEGKTPPYQVMIVDSTHNWRVDLTKDQLMGLLKLFHEVAVVSRLAKTDITNCDLVYRYCPPGAPSVAPISCKHAKSPKEIPAGRFTIGVVVDSTGRPDAHTLVVVLVSDPRVESVARDWMEGCKYQPAIKEGHPVAAVFRASLSWKQTVEIRGLH
jgi:hypothetical protein